MDYTKRHSIVLGLGMCLACACSDETNAGEPSGGSGGAAGAGMVAGSGGAAGSGMLPNGGTGGAAMPTPDAGSIGGSVGAAGSGSTSNCPTIDPVPVAGQTIAIVAIWIPQKIIYIQNITNDPIELTTEPAWQWCAFPAYGQIVQTNTTLEPGEVFAVSGLDGFDGEVSGGEVAIYDKPDFNQEESMRSFLIWNEPASDGRESVAAQGIWTFGDRATVEQGDVGLFATGRTDEGSGYTSVPASCFPLAL